MHRQASPESSLFLLLSGGMAWYSTGIFSRCSLYVLL